MPLDTIPSVKSVGGVDYNIIIGQNYIGLGASNNVIVTVIGNIILSIM